MLQITGRAKKLMCLLLVPACFGWPGVARAQRCYGGHAARAPIGGERQEPPLRLTTGIVGQRYLKNDDGSLTLHLQLRLRYTNVGYQPLILYKGSKLIHRHTTSRSAADAEAGRFTSDYALSISSAGGAELDESSLDRLFVILQPGESYERDALNVVALQVTPDAPETPGAALTPGEYVLQVTTSTWPDSEELARELGGRWQGAGLLWHDPAVSAPVPFRVEAGQRAAGRAGSRR